MSRPPTPFSVEQQAQLLPLLSTYSTLVLSQKFNLCIPRIEAIREMEGIPAPERGTSPPCYATVMPALTERGSKGEAILRRYPELPALVERGATMNEIAEALDVTRAYAPLLCRALGLTPAPEPRTSIAATRPELLEALRTSRAYRDIAREFGVTHQRVHQIAKEHGIRKPRSPNSGRRKRETILTSHQQECVEQHPEILNGDIPAPQIEGVSASTVRAIRAALGIVATHGNTGITARIVGVLDRPMTSAEIAEAILPLKASCIQVTLSLAQKAGKIKRIKYGVYAPLNYVGESP